MTEDGSIFGLSPRAPGSKKGRKGDDKQPKADERADEPRSQEPVTASGELEAVAAGSEAREPSQAPKDATASRANTARDDGEPAAKPKRKRPPRKRSSRSKATQAEPEQQEEAPAQDEARAPQPELKPKPRAPRAARPEPKPAPAPAARPKPTPEPAAAPQAPAPSATVEFAEATPDEVIAPEDELPSATLETLPQTLRDACARAGWDRLMPVQELAIPYLMAGRDLMIQSRTGSGKTASFALPILDRVDPDRASCQALVLVPTRELAQQVAREAEMLAGGTGMRVAAVYGGTGYGPQLDALRAGAHLVVGTPGRVLDHLMRGSMKLDDIQILVFDEADRMLSIGFYPDMREVQRYLPKRKVNMFMTSATYPPHVMRLAGEFMEDPQLLSLSHKRVHVAETPHLFYECKPMEKDRALVRLIEVLNPASAFIFCNTKQNVHYVTAVLQRFGYDADELSGDLNQNKREQVLARIRAGKLRFLVATDVAARGIDIPDLSHVFLYEPPEDHEIYIHRAGRTGRAGASGEVISLVDVMEKLALHRIGKMYKITLEARILPTDQDVQQAVGQRMTAHLEGKLRRLDNVQRERIERFKQLAKTLAEGEDGLDLVAMLLDDAYSKELQSAPPKPPSKAKPQRPPRQQAPAPEQDADPDEVDDDDIGNRMPDEEQPQASGAEDTTPSKSKRRRRRRRKKKPAATGDTPPSDEGAGE